MKKVSKIVFFSIVLGLCFLLGVSNVSAESSDTYKSLSKPTKEEIQEKINKVKLGPSDNEALDNKIENSNVFKMKNNNGVEIAESKVYARTEKVNNGISTFNSAGVKVESFQTTLVGIADVEHKISAKDTKNDVTVQSIIDYTTFTNRNGVVHYNITSTSTQWYVNNDGISIENEETLISQTGPSDLVGYERGFLTQKDTVYYNIGFWANVDLIYEWTPVNATFNANIGTLSKADFAHYSGSTWSMTLSNAIAGSMDSPV